MDGLLALDFTGRGDRSVTFIEQYQTTNQSLSTKLCALTQILLKQKGTRDVDQLSHVDYVTTNAHSSQGESQLYIFEDTEVVIKMIFKGRCPTMRHVSRTHRVALDWLIDRINLDPEIQVKYVDTRNQLADMLTIRAFTRDEWHHLLQLFNIVTKSVISCIHPGDQRDDPLAMSKRQMQENQRGRGEHERVAAKSRPA